MKWRTVGILGLMTKSLLDEDEDEAWNLPCWLAGKPVGARIACEGEEWRRARASVQAQLPALAAAADAEVEAFLAETHKGETPFECLLKKWTVGMNAKYGEWQELRQVA